MLQKQIHAVEQHVEWMYCFDVHCNAFFPFFLITYILQFFFLRVVKSPNLIGRLVGNTIYFSAFCYYSYITFLGYNALPFVKNPLVLLYPIGIAFVVYLISIFTFNMSSIVFSIYF